MNDNRFTVRILPLASWGYKKFILNREMSINDILGFSKTNDYDFNEIGCYCDGKINSIFQKDDTDYLNMPVSYFGIQDGDILELVLS